MAEEYCSNIKAGFVNNNFNEPILYCTITGNYCVAFKKMADPAKKEEEVHNLGLLDIIKISECPGCPEAERDELTNRMRVGAGKPLPSPTP